MSPGAVRPLPLSDATGRHTYAILVEGDIDGLMQSLSLQLKTQWFVLLEHGGDDLPIAFATQQDLRLYLLVRLT